MSLDSFSLYFYKRDHIQTKLKPTFVRLREETISQYTVGEWCLWNTAWWAPEFHVLWEEIIHCFEDVVVLIVFELSLLTVLSPLGPEGTDSEPKVDFRMDESSDVPFLEERSSSPIDFLQEQWLVGTDIENIERYTYILKFLNSFFFMPHKLYFSAVVNSE